MTGIQFIFKYLNWSRFVIKKLKRSKKWRTFRKGYLKGNPECFACGRNHWLFRITAHHIIPYYIKPELELDQTNLIPLCRRCHLLFGHLNSWDRVNLGASADISNFRDKIEQWKNRTGSL